jgi:hypothetical protein
MPVDDPGPRALDAKDVLGWEFDYASDTATQSMQDRHTMVNFYLLAVGIVSSGVLAVLAEGSGVPRAGATALLWLLCEIGWLYFLKLVRLRQAWCDSSRAMNQIKDFYVAHTAQFTPEVLSTAFRWRTNTLPAPGQLWTVFFYSGALIALLDSVAYGVGGLLLVSGGQGQGGTAAAALVILSISFFLLHIWLYSAFLKPNTH